MLIFNIDSVLCALFIVSCTAFSGQSRCARPSCHSQERSDLESRGARRRRVRRGARRRRGHRAPLLPRRRRGVCVAVFAARRHANRAERSVGVADDYVWLSARSAAENRWHSATICEWNARIANEATERGANDREVPRVSFHLVLVSHDHQEAKVIWPGLSRKDHAIRSVSKMLHPQEKRSCGKTSSTKSATFQLFDRRARRIQTFIARQRFAAQRVAASLIRAQCLKVDRCVGCWQFSKLICFNK